MKKVVLFLIFNIVSYGQNKIELKLIDIKRVYSIIKIESNDSITKKLNLNISKINKQFIFVPILKNKKYWTYMVFKKNEFYNLKNNKCLHIDSEIYFYDLRLQILTCVSYDDSTHSIIEKKNNKYYFMFNPIYGFLDSITIFKDDLVPLYSLKYAGGSLVIQNKPINLVPFCSYNFKLDSYYGFDIQDTSLHDKFKNLDVEHLYQELSLYEYKKDLYAAP